MEIKVNNFKTIEKPKKNTIFRIKIRISIEKCSFPIGKLHFSIEILIFIRKCVFFLGFSRFFDVQKIIHLNFHLRKQQHDSHT